MPLSARQIKTLLRERGWTATDLAARWGHSVTYMSRLVNDPFGRPKVYEDAFLGLPDRASVEVVRERRHARKPAKKPATVQQMFPVGRLWEAEDNAVLPEGTRVAVIAVRQTGAGVAIRFRTQDEFQEEFELSPADAASHLADLGLDA
jgi:hypothetical protein